MAQATTESAASWKAMLGATSKDGATADVAGSSGRTGASGGVGEEESALMEGLVEDIKREDRSIMAFSNSKFD
ncbi:hypothetical protein GUJ93_ZPchr0002g24525 [Zizania palustris]|uniref:Uncharacterized protein n=1 Tax=Zizania palustris TaxID=103762 RepID=A0A8J5VWL0_ZIZPA|nr:hypothetical protein GUJ93_ZPchr0002g24525 [Zizania palustris]